MAEPAAELQSLAPGSVIELFVVDATAISGGSTYRFHAGTNEVSTDIVWQGDTYTARPVKAEGFEMSTKGQLPRPKLTISNIFGEIGLLVRDLEDLIGATVTRKRTLKKFLDAVNFTGGTNPTADPTKEYPDDVYLIERKVMENKEAITFELASALDIHGLRLPSRLIQASICPWVYMGTECGYAGALATCNKTLSDATGDGGCTQHFGATAEVPFGGFPGASRIR